MSAPGIDAVAVLTGRLGVAVDPEMLVLALTHRSFAYENGGLPTNERLEFLGDSVLGIVVTDRLYRDHPDLAEGDLAKMRASCVSQRALAIVARDLGLGAYVLLGKGEISTGGSDKDSILCDTLEALFGAIYLAHGVDVATEVILKLVGPSLVRSATLGDALDWKTSLQEVCSSLGFSPPVYEVDGIGPDHARVFTATVVVDGIARGIGTGSAKKVAEQEAAEAAHAALSALAAP
ncbi:ribonuclease-3 [Demequina lutea]|uniref:Ribonuclease 3 n=2 Tax=Demequina lutea TaxID=431489 RepID=A0A7Y9ZBA8_9MICO|nr:ribonuclease-3 [Demequina lutea]